MNMWTKTTDHRTSNSVWTKAQPSDRSEFKTWTCHPGKVPTCLSLHFLKHAMKIMTKNPSLFPNSSSNARKKSTNHSSAHQHITCKADFKPVLFTQDKSYQGLYFQPESRQLHSTNPCPQPGSPSPTLLKACHSLNSKPCTGCTGESPTTTPLLTQQEIRSLLFSALFEGHSLAWTRPIKLVSDEQSFSLAPSSRWESWTSRQPNPKAHNGDESWEKLLDV
jgi:hypothetical protein